MQIRCVYISIINNPIRSYLLLVLILLLSLTGCAGMAGGSNPATATAQAQRAMDMATQVGSHLHQTQAVERQSALATAQAEDTFLRTATDWPLLLEDGFDDNENSWAIDPEEDPELATIDWKIDKGKYRWEAQALSPFVWWVTPDQFEAGDFYLAVTGKQVDGPDDGEYGLVFRMNEEGEYYVFEVSETGYFGLFLYSQEGWQALVNWTETALIQSGAENRLEVTARGDTFYLSVNGKRLTEFTNNQIPTGQAGLLIGLYESGDQGIWEFDDFEFRSPDAIELPTATP